VRLNEEETEREQVSSSLGGGEIANWMCRTKRRTDTGENKIQKQEENADLKDHINNSDREEMTKEKGEGGKKRWDLVLKKKKGHAGMKGEGNSAEGDSRQKGKGKDGDCSKYGLDFVATGERRVVDDL